MKKRFEKLEIGANQPASPESATAQPNSRRLEFAGQRREQLAPTRSAGQTPIKKNSSKTPMLIAAGVLAAVSLAIWFFAS